ncbi:hypothetical protein IWQ60_008613, partial [Tieghemiomyces parasiticus]
MKKFEELERIQRQVAGRSSTSQAATPQPTAEPALKEEVTISPSVTTDVATTGDADLSDSPDQVASAVLLPPSGTTIVMGMGHRTESDPPPLTQEQLEEVFRQTSSFTVKTATIDYEDYEELEWWKAEMEDANTAEFVEENDYVAVDDEFWDEEFGEAPAKKARGKRATTAGTTATPKEPRAPRHDKESIIQRYRIMQVKLQDKQGNYFFIRKKVSAVDPSLPTYVRIPPVPIPSSWVFHITNLIEQQLVPECHRRVDDDIFAMDLLGLGNRFQAIYMDPPLLLPGEPVTPGKITIDQLSSLPVGDMTPNGFLFVWVEKELLPDMVYLAARWRFKYVENFCWIKKRVNNQIARQTSTYFRKSKLTLLIFRKEGEIDIRHQRSPDSLFDFIKPTEP